VKNSLFHEVFKEFERPVAIAVVHLPPLPGSHSFSGSVEEIVDYVLREVHIIEEAGFDALLIENFGDAPFLKRVRNPVTLTAFTVVVREAVRSSSIPVGINLLRNSACEAYAAAYAAGAKFIRVNAYVETLVTDSGIIEPAAPKLLRLRSRYPGIAVFADVMCKHAVVLGVQSATPEYIRATVLDAVERGKADAIIVTGRRTGEPPDPWILMNVRKALDSYPVLMGSGANLDNLEYYLRFVEGVIVGSFIKENGRAGRATDRDRAKMFVQKFREVIATLTR